MIRFELDSGKDVKINRDLSKAMRGVAQIMKRSIKLNFQAGGRPVPWMPKKDGTARPLWGSGVLRSTLRSEYGKNYAEAAMGAGLKYAWIHQKGGLAGRGHKANIPARPYMVLQREDLENIAKLVGAFIVEAPGGEDAIY